MTDASVLADLAALKLEQGDAEGAELLFRKALEQRQKQETAAAGGTGAEPPADGRDDWEAWDEASVPVVGAAAQQPAAAAAAADSWESAAAAAPPARPSRSSPAARPAAAPRASPAASRRREADYADDDESAGVEEEVELQFGGGHVLEFYDLTPAVRTQHLEAFLERHVRCHAAPPVLRWVDDCHAAVSCSDPAAARQLLAAATAPKAAPEFKLRGFADAGSGTRKLPGSELLPPKPRPKTSAAVARRLIGGALNLKLRDRDAEQQLTAARRQQREEREERQKAQAATWDG